MQLFLLYFCLPFFGINIPKYLTALLGLSFYTGAYVGEIVKAGLNSVDVGQKEAARSLGLTPGQEFRAIVLPQALRVIIPPTFGFFIALIKDSSLVSMIGYVELTRASKMVVTRTFQPFTLYLGAALLYFIICYGLSRFETGYLHKRLSAFTVKN
jgi:polar amino acid transport system permease protein